MANVVWLRPEESPPESENWALVAQDVNWWHYGSGTMEHLKGATFYMPYPASETDHASAIAKAISWADKHGVTTVYVVAT